MTRIIEIGCVEDLIIALQSCKNKQSVVALCVDEFAYSWIDGFIDDTCQPEVEGGNIGHALLKLSPDSDLGQYLAKDLEVCEPKELIDIVDNDVEKTMNFLVKSKRASILVAHSWMTGHVYSQVVPLGIITCEEAQKWIYENFPKKNRKV